MSTKAPGKGQEHSITPPQPPAQDNGKPRKASVSGIMVKDPDLHYTSAGKPVATLRVVVKDRVKNEQSGQWEDTNVRFYDVKAWNNLGERAVNCLQKGDRVVVMGTWTRESWQAKDSSIAERWVITADDVGASVLWKDVRVIRSEQDI